MLWMIIVRNGLSQSTYMTKVEPVLAMPNNDTLLLSTTIASN